MIPEFTVTEITRIFQNFVHETFHYIRIKGEIGKIHRPKSGNIYLILKDKNSFIDAVCWKNTKIQIELVEGIEVLFTGHLTSYQSRYQFMIIEASKIGQGNLQLQLQNRKTNLSEEGLFDKKNKRNLPVLPKRLGIITSKTGSVINDIINRVQHRFPTHVMIWSSSVQGKFSLQEILQAIQGFNNMTSNIPDIIIIARGGGSAEDLQVFNEEKLVRAISSSRIPIVSAIGHENDLTLSDYASDMSAPTPTAAIEMVLPLKQQLFENLHNKSYYITSLMRNKLNIYKHMLLEYRRKLTNPIARIELLDLTMNKYNNTINLKFQKLILQKKQLLDQLFIKICRYDQKRLLEIGYTLVYDKDKKHISNSTSLQKSDEILIRWKDGIHKAVIIE